MIMLVFASIGDFAIVLIRAVFNCVESNFAFALVLLYCAL